MSNYTSGYAQTAIPVSAFAKVAATDFGQVGGAAPSLAYNAGAGSLAMSTARVAITWITAQGESLVSTEATVAVSAATGSVTVTQPPVPTNGAAVLGWRVYSSSGGAGSALLNAAAPSTTQVQQNFTTSQGILAGFPVATTAVQILIYGAGQAEPVIGNSGIQTALPSVPANSTADYSFVIGNNSNRFKVQKDVQWMLPDGTAQTSGIVIAGIDCIAPVYPGTSTSVSVGAFTFLNSTLYEATTAGTTAATFIGAAAFNAGKGSTTTDGTVVWTSLGRAVILRAHFANVSGSAAIPAAQTFLFIQL